MKPIKLLLSAVLAAGALASAAMTSAAAAAPAAVQEAPITLGQAVQQVQARLRTGASVADSDWFYLRVSGRGDGYCLDNFANGGGANNSPVGLWTCNGGITEKWRLRTVASGTAWTTSFVNESSGRCLDYPASAGDNIGWQFNVYDCRNGSAPGQNYLLNSVGSIEFLITSQATSHPVAIDAFTSFWHGDGSPVGLWTYTYPGNLFQHWY